MVKASDVFVPGGQPTLTYVSRSNPALEQAVRNHLDSPYRILSITGPTKSGKTVLVRAVLDGSMVWVPGSSLNSVADLWQQVSFKLGLWSAEAGELSHQESTSATSAVGTDLKVIRGETGDSTEDTVTRGRQHSRDVPLHLIVPEELRKSGTVLIIDDFHYLKRSLQREIVRALKPALFDGTAIILISVPHRTYDSVRAEPEMTGRVTHLAIPLWDEPELRSIAEAGFQELNAQVEKSVLHDLAEQAAGSPHLMQDFCLRLCRINEVLETQSKVVGLGLADRTAFYEDCAGEAASRVEFTRFLKGLQPRKKRKPRGMKGGFEADIYRAVMMAIITIGPRSSMSLEEIRSSLASLIESPSDLPAKHEVTRVLNVLDELAKSTSQTDPVLEYDEEEDRLYILDPFFGFAARWIGGYVK